MTCFCGGIIETHKDRAMCMSCGHLEILPEFAPKPDADQLPGECGHIPTPSTLAGAFYSDPRGWQHRPDAAPGGSLLPRAGRGTEQRSITND